MTPLLTPPPRSALLPEPRAKALWGKPAPAPALPPLLPRPVLRALRSPGSFWCPPTMLHPHACRLASSQCNHRCFSGAPSRRQGPGFPSHRPTWSNLGTPGCWPLWPACRLESWLWYFPAKTSWTGFRPRPQPRP
uniref:Uncharacterized protein n=1 Tax=Pipistrellus kuhlii TaxID=59472 RepID=A0A7J7R9Z2_PIPKU|nr:hypothetical protein mPipKuh1_010705 [Pipistrellus kuhlii]